LTGEVTKGVEVAEVVEGVHIDFLDHVADLDYVDLRASR
jgi:hypothetical protein